MKGRDLYIGELRNINLELNNSQRSILCQDWSYTAVWRPWIYSAAESLQWKSKWNTSSITIFLLPFLQFPLFTTHYGLLDIFLDRVVSTLSSLPKPELSRCKSHHHTEVVSLLEAPLPQLLSGDELVILLTTPHLNLPFLLVGSSSSNFFHLHCSSPGFFSPSLFITL